MPASPGHPPSPTTLRPAVGGLRRVERLLRTNRLRLHQRSNVLPFGILMAITGTAQRPSLETMSEFDLLRPISFPLIPGLERNHSQISIIIRSRLTRRASGFSTSRGVLSKG